MVLGKNIWAGGTGPSSFGRQLRLSEITIEAISGVLPKFRWVYARNMAPSSERWTLKVRGSTDRGAERRGVLGRGCHLLPLPSRLEDLGERCELPGRQRILGIFQGLRILLVETMHYGTNQKIWGAWARFGGPVPPGLSLKPPLVSLPVPEIIGGTLKIWEVPGLDTSMHAPFSPKFLMGFCSDRPCECTGQI